MNFLKLLGGAVGTIGDITGIDALKNFSKMIDEDKIPPEQKLLLETALLAHQEKMESFAIDKLKIENETLKIQISEALAMIQSSDKYTSRARPTGVYAATLITFILAVAMIFGIKLDNGAIATLLVPLWGSAAFYTYNRTKEKINGGDK